MGKRKEPTGCLVLLALPLVLLFGKCSGNSSIPAIEPPPAATVAATPLPTPPSRFVNTNSLNVRSAPNGAVVARLERGRTVTVFEESAGWTRISAPNATPEWVSAALLCTGENCFAPTQASSNGNSLLAIRHSSRPRRTIVASDSDCPCSSGRNCFGPRGGRFCITSGGNKRYR
jgi:SH3-like domain-containing protein